MIELTTRAIAVVVVGAAAFSLLAGCNSSTDKHAKKDEGFHADFFDSPQQQRAVDRFVEVQAAEGAKEDAMLFATHFDGDELNTAGQAKLNLMMRNLTPREPMVVYMSLAPKDPMAAARRAAVEQFVKDSGIAVAHLDIKEGDNPGMRTTASANLHNLGKTDSDYKGGQQGGGGNEGVTSQGVEAPSMTSTPPASK
jgi:hypothetical protein